MTRHKPQTWYIKFNQPKRNPNGRNWKPHPTTHRDPADGTYPSPGGITWIPTATWRTLNAGVPVSAGVDPGADDTSVTYFTWAIYPILNRLDKGPPSIPYAGVRAGEIIGHRMWMILDNLELCSLAHHFIWQPGVTVEGKLDVVVDNSMFWKTIYGGVYSFNALEHITKELNEFDLEDLPRPISFSLCGSPYFFLHGLAIGTVKCWGEVIEHEKGWRSQYAKLTSITDVIGPVDINKLRRKYNV